MGRFSKGILFALAPACAFAQEDSVVVSATRVPQPSLEIPAAVDRIYGDEIHEGRPQVNLSESLGRVPGIVVQNRQNYAQDLQIQSRGFGARSTFGVRGVRLIADGIPATMPDGQGQAATFALGSADRIEVLRGPFSTLYGNASGGVINVVTEDGPARPTLEGDLLAGSYRTRRAGVKFGGQWGSLNAIGDLSRFETNGYRDHSAAQRDHLNAKLRYGFTDDTSVTLVANQLRQPQTQDPGGLTRAQVDQNPRQVQPGVIQFDARKTILHEQSGATLSHRIDGSARLEGTAYVGQRWVEQFLNIPAAAQAPVTHSGGVVALDRNFGGGALRYFKDLYQDLKLSAGAEYDLMRDKRRGYLNNNGVRGALKRDELNEVWTTGLYAQGEWKFAARWSAHAGVRRTKIQFRNTDYFIVPNTANGDDSGERSYSATTPAAGLVFRVNSNTSLYGNVGKGFETPTFVELANRNGGSGLNFGLNASSSRHAEIGAKSIIPGWVRVNAALFKIVTENEIVVDTNSGGRATFKNVGHTDRNGFELGAETLWGGPIEARVAYTYLKATYRETFNTVISVTGSPQVTVPAGSMIPGVPRNVLYGELRYRRESFFVTLEALRKSKVAVNDPNTEFADGYTTANLVGGLVQQDGRWRITEFVRIDNVTDKNYVGSVIVNEGNARYYEPSPRRNMTIGLQANLRF
jgi:iron complex outermembrane receptor protein